MFSFSHFLSLGSNKLSKRFYYYLERFLRFQAEIRITSNPIGHWKTPTLHRNERTYLLAESWPSFVSEDRFRQMARERVIMAAHVWETRARNHWTPIAVWPLTNIDIRGTYRVRTTYRLSRVNWVNWIAPCRGRVENAPGIQSTNCRLRAIHSSCAEEILLVEGFCLVSSLKIFVYLLTEILWIITKWKLWKWWSKEKVNLWNIWTKFCYLTSSKILARLCTYIKIVLKRN